MNKIRIKIKKYLESKLSVLLEPAVNRIISSQFSTNQQLQIILKLLYDDQVLEKKRKFDFDKIGFNVYSSTNEDGILLYIFSIIGMETRKCIDIGAGLISGSNSANLIINQGFKGLLIDASSERISSIKKYYQTHGETASNPPTIICERVNRDNINEIIERNGFSGNIDLLTIDIDGIDYWILKAISVIKPKIIIVEYQDALGPELSWTVPYKPDYNFREHEINLNDYNYTGASLNAFVKICEEKGFRLVGCNKGGWNAFFIASGFGEQYLPEIKPEDCFRYERNFYSMKNRFPLIKDLEWIHV